MPTSNASAAERRTATAAFDNVVALYMLERDDAPAAAVASLGPRLLARWDCARAAHRSRAGRLLAAQVADERVGRFVADALAAWHTNGAAAADLAFRAVDGIKARTLLDQLALGTGAYRPPADAAAGAAVAALERAALRYAPRRPGDRETLDERRLASRLPLGRPRDVDALETLLAEHDAGLRGSTPVPPLADVCAALGPDEVLVEYCLPRRGIDPAPELWAVVLTQAGAQALPLSLPPLDGQAQLTVGVDGQAPIDFYVLNEVAVGLRRAVREGLDAPEPFRAAYDLFIAPLADAGVTAERYRHWVIVPDAVLHYVPFAALLAPDGEPLGTTVALTIAPSAATWHRLRAPAPAIHTFLGLADPAVPGLPPLPGARDELLRTCKLLGTRGVRCEGYLDADASESCLKARAAGAGVVHLAAHGEAPDEEAIDFHTLRLAASGADDGRLRAHEIRALDLSAASLAVLSVCDSGTYRFGPGNELHGFVAALLAAGARTAVATLWPVDDAAARRLMGHFYRHALTHGAAEALRRARAEERRARAAPARDWAAFVAVGAGRPGR